MSAILDMNNSFENVCALVLRVSDYKDSDKMLTLLTDGYGKLGVLARRAKRPGSRLMVATQQFSYSRFTIFSYRNRKSINEAEPIHFFLSDRPDIDRLALATYFSDLLEEVADEDCPGDALLRFALNGFSVLERAARSIDHVKSVFEIKLMAIAGFAPLVSACASCGRTHAAKWTLGIEHGCIWCDDCSGHIVGDGAFEMGAGAAAALRYVLDGSRNPFSFELDDTAQRQFSRITEAFVQYHLGRRFASLDYYKDLRYGFNGNKQQEIR